MEEGTIRCACLGIVIFVSLLCIVEGEVMFTVGNPKDNEVIFEGEDVPLICTSSAKTADEIKISIFFEDVVLVSNGTDISGGIISDVIITSKDLRIVLRSVGPSQAGRYKCETIDNRGMLEENNFYLEVFNRESVQCRQNSTIMYLSMQSLELSCYFATSEGKSFEWYKTVSSGSSVISSTLSEITSHKGRLVAIIEPSEDLEPLTFSCQSSDQSNTGCLVEQTYVVYSRSFITFTPSVFIILPGDEVNVSCQSVDLPSTIATIPFWSSPFEVPEGVTASNRLSHNTLEIVARTNATVGSTINATCCLFIEQNIFKSDLSITIGSEEDQPSGGRQDVTENGLSTVAVIIIAIIGSIILVGIIFSIICILTIRNQYSDTESESGIQETRLSQIYSKVDKIRRTGPNEPDSVNVNQYDVTGNAHGPVTDEYIHDPPQHNEMGNYAGTFEHIDNLHGAYNRVNFGYLQNQEEIHRSEQEEPFNDLENPALYSSNPILY